MIQHNNSGTGEHEFTCDFHIHSHYSFDSILPIKKIIKISKRRNIDGIAITDHNAIKGAFEAKCQTNNDLMVIIGSEIRTEYGDIIGLFLNEEISSRIFVEVIDEIESQGGVIMAPHPYKSQIKNYLKFVDIIEVKNARISENLNRMASEYARKNNSPGVGSSDAHLGYEIGAIKTTFPHPINTEEELRREILRNNCQVNGNISPRWVHYFSASVGALKTGNIGRLIQSTVKRNLHKY